MKLSAEGAEILASTPASKKISLKVMTLSNSKQKVNDVLGNPVEVAVAAMVSNLLVVLCGNHDAQPVVNSGSLY